jgi:hypothetical protein
MATQLLKKALRDPHRELWNLIVNSSCFQRRDKALPRVTVKNGRRRQDHCLQKALAAIAKNLESNINVRYWENY